ncbi:hypothetical protein F2P81_025183 [Scophthalmus maximus]|uniref:Uncharacterized protein n=1 Tax=Scophthalmus maximus TaxID=52904 RepID=A0A6A4RQK3_SCOMX|nr:hypothetical protein F2P81_025183 [Scophthalmus maximus]
MQTEFTKGKRSVPCSSGLKDPDAPGQLISLTWLRCVSPADRKPPHRPAGDLTKPFPRSFDFFIRLLRHRSDRERRGDSKRTSGSTDRTMQRSGPVNGKNKRVVVVFLLTRQTSLKNLTILHLFFTCKCKTVSQQFNVDVLLIDWVLRHIRHGRFVDNVTPSRRKRRFTVA